MRGAAVGDAEHARRQVLNLGPTDLGGCEKSRYTESVCSDFYFCVVGLVSDFVCFSV